MTSPSFAAFSDELTKIAAMGPILSRAGDVARRGAQGFGRALKEGWHGPAHDPNTWLGKGRQIRSGMSRFGRGVEEATSLGGLTRALPVGSKSMMLLGTGLMAREAMRPEDPTGRERSRAERLSGLAGNTLGGLAGAAVGQRWKGKPMLGGILGGVLGGMAGEKVMAAPFAAARQMRGRQPVPQQVPQQQVPNAGVPA